MSPVTDATRPRTRGPSLRTRWTLALLGVAALPLALLSFVTLRALRAGLERAERELEVAVIDRVSFAISGDLDWAGEATHRAGVALLDARAGEPAERVAMARDVMARADALLHVGVYDADGRRVDTILRREGSRVPDALEHVPDALLQSPPSGGVWLRPEFTPTGVAVRYVEPLSVDGRVSAWVVGTLDPRWLDALAHEVSRDRFQRDDGVIVTDDEMRLLVRGPLPVGASLAGRDVFAHVLVPREHLARALVINTRFDADEPMVGTLRSFPERRWIVAVRRPEREAFADLVAARRVLLTGALACALFAAALGALMGRRATRPIDALAALTRAYAQRRFAERSTVETGDELESLGRSLEGMADSIRAGELEIVRRERVEHDLSRFLPAEVATAVARGEKSLALGGARRAVTVLFADVASFTSFAEGEQPERVVAFLNELFTVLTEVVFRHGGMVDKFIGDCVMAVFGTGSDPRDAALEGPDAPAARALAAAEDIHRFVEASAPAWKEAYGIDVRLGVGVNAGEALVGNLGSEARMEYTVIGDVVNVAARLESLARGGQTLATAAVVRAAGTLFLYTPLGAHPLRGKREMVDIFEVTT